MNRKSLKINLLSLAVFLVGASVTIGLYRERVHDYRQEQLQAESDIARKLHYELQRHIDRYNGAMQFVAAFLSASKNVSDSEFREFIRSSELLKRQKAISSTGYLPKVPVVELQQFEHRARRMFPSFEVRRIREGAAYAFPLLYAERTYGDEVVERLRGLDYSSIPDRYSAMLAAVQHDAPAATRPHASADDLKTSVVLTFMPVKHSPFSSAEPEQRLEQVRGFAMAVLQVDELFGDFFRTLGGSEGFDLEVFDGEVSEATLIFDGNHASSALAGTQAIYRAELQFANRRWSAFFFPITQAPGANGLDWLLLVVGFGLSLGSAAAVIFFHRLVVARRQGKELLDRFDSFFENHPFAVCSIDTQWRFIHANHRLAAQLGVSQEELAGRSVGDFVSEENRAMAAEHFAESLRGEAVAYNNVLVGTDGRRSDMSVVLVPMSSQGKVAFVLALAENITERKRAEARLYESRQMLRLILDTVPQRIFWKDLDGVYAGGNRSLLEDAGLASVDELIGKTDFDMPWRDLAEQYQAEDANVVASGAPWMKTQYAHVRRDGSEMWVEASKMPLMDDKGKAVGVLGVVEDITERKATEQELFRRANYDNLTGLPNRSYFYSQLNQAIKRANRHPDALALMFFDIDHFKQINDTYGHDVGDHVIRMFAERIRSVLRDEDVVARLGGDEFVLIVENLPNQQQADVVAEKLLASMEQPFVFGGTSLQVSTSIGVAYFRRGITAGELVKAADDAMYAAKRAGRNCYRKAA